MPTYDYVCRSCEHELEAFQAITARPKRKCPRCGRSTLERRIGTGAGILFRGTGFYQTDYRSESYTRSKKAESAADKPDSSGKAADSKPVDTKSADSKPAGGKAAGGKAATRKAEG